MRIAVIAPPWYPVPPSGYGGIEWVVSLLADGLTERGHQLTLFAPPGSETEAELVPPLGEVPPEELIGDPWYEAAHAISALTARASSICCMTTPGRSERASGP